MPITVSTARNIRNEPARYMSWLCSAASNIGPVVCSDITAETITEPDTTCGSRLPMSAMNGLRAILSGYFTRSRPEDSPFARPVTTYCFCNSSRRLARSRRIIPAVPDVPITSTGTQRCSRSDRTLPMVHGWSIYFAAINVPIDVPK